MRWAAILLAACTVAHAQIPGVESASISPSGRHVALLAAPEKGFLRLLTLDTQSLAPRAVATARDANVTNVQWVNDKRLVYQIVDTTKSWTEFTFPVALYAVDVDGENYKYLVRFPEDHSPDAPVQDARMRFRGRAGGDEIFVSRWFGESGEVKYVGMWVLNTRNGRLRVAETAPTPPAALDEAALKSVQARIDATLRDAVNRIEAPSQPDVPMLLVTSSPANGPSSFYLYDRVKERLVFIARGLSPRP